MVSRALIPTTIKVGYNDGQKLPLKVPGPSQNHLEAVTKTATVAAGTYSGGPCGGQGNATEEQKKKKN